MIRKFHLAKLSRNGDWEGIRKDQALFGPIPDDLQKGLKALCGSRGSDSRLSSGVRLWGSGRPKREFLHVDDLASACLFLFKLADDAYAAACAGRIEQTDRPPQEDQPGSTNSRPADRNRVSHINVGSGKDVHIAELAEIVQEVVGYEGRVGWDTSMPDGTPRKLLDVSRLTRLGWKPRISLREGINSTYEWYLAQSELY
jgi:GDP-L-fucose synthase